MYAAILAALYGQYFRRLNMISRTSSVILMALPCFSLFACQTEIDNKQEDGPAFSISFDADLTEAAQDGRLLLLLAAHDDEEPRFLVDNSADTQLVFGLNVGDWQSDTEVVIDKSAIGFPLANLSQAAGWHLLCTGAAESLQGFSSWQRQDCESGARSGGRTAVEP